MKRKKLTNKWIELFELECMMLFTKKQLKYINEELDSLSKKRLKKEVKILEKSL